MGGGEVEEAARQKVMVEARKCRKSKWAKDKKEKRRIRNQGTGQEGGNRRGAGRAE